MIESEKKALITFIYLFYSMVFPFSCKHDCVGWIMYLGNNEMDSKGGALGHTQRGGSMCFGGGKKRKRKKKICCLLTARFYLIYLDLVMISPWRPARPRPFQQASGSGKARQGGFVELDLDGRKPFELGRVANELDFLHELVQKGGVFFRGLSSTWDPLTCDAKNSAGACGSNLELRLLGILRARWRTDCGSNSAVQVRSSGRFDVAP